VNKRDRNKYQHVVYTHAHTHTHTHTHTHRNNSGNVLCTQWNNPFMRVGMCMFQGMAHFHLEAEG